MATVTQESARRLSFWQKMAAGLGLLVAFSFAQFAARGYVDIPRVPVWVHIHAVVMLGWLTLGFVQPSLARSGNLALHRRLGWLGVAMALAVCMLGSFSAIMAIGMQRVPPIFTPAYFLALTQIGILVFGAMVLTAVLKRRDTRWHQRLMLGSTVLILEPALGRVLPMPLLVPWGEWVVMVFQLGAAWLIARHDKASLGAVHPATKTVLAVIVLTHVVIEALARTALFAAMAERIATG